MKKKGKNKRKNKKDNIKLILNDFEIEKITQKNIGNKNAEIIERDTLNITKNWNTFLINNKDEKKQKKDISSFFENPLETSLEERKKTEKNKEEKYDSINNYSNKSYNKKLEKEYQLVQVSNKEILKNDLKIKELNSFEKRFFEINQWSSISETENQEQEILEKYKSKRKRMDNNMPKMPFELKYINEKYYLKEDYTFFQ